MMYNYPLLHQKIMTWFGLRLDKEKQRHFEEETKKNDKDKTIARLFDICFMAAYEISDPVTFEKRVYEEIKKRAQKLPASRSSIAIARIKDFGEDLINRIKPYLLPGLIITFLLSLVGLSIFGAVMAFPFSPLLFLLAFVGAGLVATFSSVGAYKLIQNITPFYGGRSCTAEYLEAENTALPFYQGFLDYLDNKNTDIKSMTSGESVHCYTMHALPRSPVFSPDPMGDMNLNMNHQQTLLTVSSTSSLNDLKPQNPSPQTDFFQSKSQSLMEKKIAYYKKKMDSTLIEIKADIASLRTFLSLHEAHLKKKDELKSSLALALRMSATASKIGGYKQELHEAMVFAPWTPNPHPMKFVPKKEMKSVPYYVPDENVRAQWAAEASSLKKQLHTEQEKYQSPPHEHESKQQLESLMYQLQNLRLQLETQPTQLGQIIQQYETIMQSVESIKLDRRRMDQFKGHPVTVMAIML